MPNCCVLRVSFHNTSPDNFWALRHTQNYTKSSVTTCVHKKERCFMISTNSEKQNRYNISVTYTHIFFWQCWFLHVNNKCFLGVILWNFTMSEAIFCHTNKHKTGLSDVTSFNSSASRCNAIGISSSNFPIRVR